MTLEYETKEMSLVHSLEKPTPPKKNILRGERGWFPVAVLRISDPIGNMPSDFTASDEMRLLIYKGIQSMIVIKIEAIKNMIKKGVHVSEASLQDKSDIATYYLTLDQKSGTQQTTLDEKTAMDCLCDLFWLRSWEEGEGLDKRNLDCHMGRTFPLPAQTSAFKLSWGKTMDELKEKLGEAWLPPNYW